MFILKQILLRFKKTKILFLAVIISVFTSFNTLTYGYVSKDFSYGYSEYWSSSAELSGYTHVGNTTFTGEWWDGLVKNKTWTYIDYQLSNSYTATYETLLTSPTLKPKFSDEMYIGYKYTKTFLKQSKTSIYGYLELEDAYQVNNELFSVYSTNITTKGFEINLPLIINSEGNSYPSGYEYSIGLYKIHMKLSQRKVYRYEIGSWWSKTVREEIENKSEQIKVAYIAIPVRVDQEFRTPTYFYNNSGLDRILIK